MLFLNSVWRIFQYGVDGENTTGSDNLALLKFKHFAFTYRAFLLITKRLFKTYESFKPCTTGASASSVLL